MIRAIQGLDGFMNPLIGNLPPSDTIYAVDLAANTSQQIQIPTGANLVVFGPIPGANQYIKFVNSTISVPGGNILDGSAPERMRVCKVMRVLFRLCRSRLLLQACPTAA